MAIRLEQGLLGAAREDNEALEHLLRAPPAQSGDRLRLSDEPHEDLVFAESVPSLVGFRNRSNTSVPAPENDRSPSGPRWPICRLEGRLQEAREVNLQVSGVVEPEEDLVEGNLVRRHRAPIADWYFVILATSA